MLLSIGYKHNSSLNTLNYITNASSKRIFLSSPSFKMDLKCICIISHISTQTVMCWHYNKHSCQQSQIFRCSSSALISEPASTSSGQSVSLDDSGKPLGSLNVHRLSPNLAVSLRWLFITIYKDAPNCRLPVLTRTPHALLFESTESYTNQLVFYYIIGLSVYAGI